RRRRHVALQPSRAARRGRCGAAGSAVPSRHLPRRAARGESGGMAIAEREQSRGRGGLARVNSRLGNARAVPTFSEDHRGVSWRTRWNGTRKRACLIEDRAGLPVAFLNRATTIKPVLVAWSGGKDSALALREIQRDGRYRVAALLTTVTAEYDRISMHGVRRSLLHRQAESLGLALEEVVISRGATNDEYETNMGGALAA